MNIAHHMKLGWSLVKEPGKLCNQGVPGPLLSHSTLAIPAAQLEKIVRDYNPVATSLSGLLIVSYRIRTHLWLTAHAQLMTNDRRFQLSLTESPVCTDCPTHVESLAHVFRDCWRARQMWDPLIAGRQRLTFYSSNFLSWLESNLANAYGFQGSCSWPLLFGVVLSKLWEWRNERCFNPSSTKPHSLQDILSYVQDIGLAYQFYHTVAPSSPHQGSQVIEVSWSPPREGWVNLATDGSSCGNPRAATAGGLLRDASGRWIVGFGANVGFCSAWHAELWAVFYGLHLAWAFGYSSIDLSIDYVLVVSLISSASSPVLNTLVSAIRKLLSRNWEVRVRHIYREGNRCVDWLANYSYGLPLGVR
ncbi:hypothetical protein K2173_023686 [Erythroxylum novogranatense]|uniref:RNase H type-1 domain-containing protein n=1 Tax=Erythroxylum novogranatense TaxID=1862640 RepID=A0AAV8TPH2_9ROSI|nr:hypothetical protein K2173_023686 [Erythroxylum novogranatense]